MGAAAAPSSTRAREHPPAPRGQGTDPPKRRHIPSPALSLTPGEAQAVRCAARNIARTYGGLGKLAAVLGVNRNILTQKRKRPHPGLAVALARVSGMSVDAVLGWKALAAVPSQGGAHG